MNTRLLGFFLPLWLGFLMPSAGAQNPSLSFEQAWQIAQQRDSQLAALQSDASAARLDGAADAELPDPDLFGRLEGFDLDGFDGGPRMASIGIGQSFPAGDSRAWRQRVGERQADSLAAEQEARRRWLRATLSEEWLAVRYWQQAIEELERAETQLASLVESVKAQYRVGLGRQQGLVQARVEMLRFTERRVQAERELAEARARLSQWLGESARQTLGEWPLPASLPVEWDRAEQHLEQHPELLALEQVIEQRRSQVGLAEAAFKPDWRAEAMLMRRDAGAVNGGHSTELGVGVRVSLPLFAERRQQRRLDAAKARVDSAQSRRQVRWLSLRSRLHGHWQRLERLEEILLIYSEQLLPGTEEAVESALVAYQSQVSDDLTDLVRARVSEAETRLNRLRTLRDYAQTQAGLVYLVGLPD
jgi:outer membrane protein TolC